MSYPRQEPLSRETAERIVELVPTLDSRVGLGAWLMMDTMISTYGLNHLRWRDVDCERRMLASVQMGRNRKVKDLPIRETALVKRLEAWKRYEDEENHVLSGGIEPLAEKVASRKIVALGEAFGLDFCSYNLRHAAREAVR